MQKNKVKKFKKIHGVRKFVGWGEKTKKQPMGFSRKKGQTKNVIKDLLEVCLHNGWKLHRLRDGVFVEPDTIDYREQVYSYDLFGITCEKGHKFIRKVERILIPGMGCFVCKKRAMKLKYSILDLKLYAHDNGGECLSEEYTRVKDKYKFRCKYGHEWETAWAWMRRDRSWCAQCAFNSKKKIRMQKRKNSCQN